MINNQLNRRGAKFYRHLLWMVAVFSVLAGCKTYYQPISERNFSHLYNPMHTDIHPVLMLNRVAPDSSVIFLHIPVSDIAFPEFKRREDQVAGVAIEYFLVDSAGANMFRDSGSVKYAQPQKPATNFLQLQLGFAHHPDSVKYVDLRIQDLLSELETNEVVRLRNDHMGNPQRYFAYFNDKKYPFTRTIAAEGDSVKVNYRGENDSLWVFHLTYNRKASLPFDTAYKFSKNDFLRFSISGSYVINSDSTLNGGLRYVVSNPYFPAIRQARQMLGPIRYLINGKEWRQINQLSPKHAVDTFWLKAAPDAEKAKQLIQVFYNRVQLANIKFSSHRAGWKTDMGKVITLAGLPDEVQLTDTSEHWFYYIGKNEKLKIPFAYNDSLGEYQLNRNDSLMNGFLMHHINGWRKGKFY
ncbi:MAG TPA: GWxTD domain-containing protein [Salinivirga sp.]|uniref:GWxTD domain-containing protein n=1 Tax=Salinivirga sp. TaxID=1970192 RepID=UPI002B468AC9|nr:GWxTD domain-containing protein [Salinivirga sp.]HKK58871.1 GWxTD domain-containing protein [Salinivirga sp.]